MSVWRDTVRLHESVQVVSTVPDTDNVLSLSMDVEEITDITAPIVMVQHPEPGSEYYASEFRYLIDDLPKNSGETINAGSFEFYVDESPWVLHGRPIGETCYLQFELLFGGQRARVAIIPKVALSDGLHGLRIVIADTAGNVLNYSSTFTQSLIAQYARFSLNSETVVDETPRPKTDQSSWDFKLKRKCNHTLVQEPYFVASDLQTVFLNRFVASVSSVEVRVNGETRQPDDPKLGYRVVLDRRSVAPYQKHKIVFNTSVKSPTDVIEVSYTTDRGTCTKCETWGYLDDFAVVNGREIERVEWAAKLRQEVDKIVLTSVGTNPVYQWYGTQLVSYIGSKRVVRRGVVSTQLKSQIQEALHRLQELKTRVQAQYQKVAKEEMIASIDKIDVQVFADDPTSFTVEITLTNGGGTRLSIQTGITVLDTDTLAERRF